MTQNCKPSAIRSLKARTIPPSRPRFAPSSRGSAARGGRAASIAPDGAALADMRQNRSSRRQAVVDLSALIPQSSNLFVGLARGIRSQ